MLTDALKQLSKDEHPILHSDSNNAGISFYHHSVCCLTRLV
ncbi:transposase, partial [Escherichia coli]